MVRRNTLMSDVYMMEGVADDWPKQLDALLKKDRRVLDAVVDSAGGDIMKQLGTLLKQGGRVVCYGM